MNHVSLVGNLGQDVSVEISANGNLYARLSLATHYRDRTTWLFARSTRIKPRASS